MSQLVVVSTNPALDWPLRAQVAHDLRNLFATVGLHLETLQRLSGPSGAKAANAAHVLLTRGTALCNDALDRTTVTDSRPRRKVADLIGIACHVADLLAPTAPKDFFFDISQSRSASVLADPNETFRILFNLMSNAVAVANRKARPLTSVKIHIDNEDSMVIMRLADDGPGLPAGIRAGLFGARSRRSAPCCHGYGLAIARELAERNGGTLTLVPSDNGTTFALKLPPFVSLVQDKPQDLGRRAMVV
jgi:signal transduction histidine kinase